MGISIDLGNRFRRAIRDLITTVTSRPESFSRVHEELRAALTDRFPYVVLFETESEGITILGIFHAASDRERWKERTL